MHRSARVNAAICVSVAAAGIGVAVAGALLDPKDVDTRTRRSSSDVFSDVSSREDLNYVEPSKEYKELCTAYNQNKDAIAKLFKFVGQLVVAPIVMIGVEKLNDAYGNPLCF